jgi:hypothetical protein
MSSFLPQHTLTAAQDISWLGGTGRRYFSPLLRAFTVHLCLNHSYVIPESLRVLIEATSASSSYASSSHRGAFNAVSVHCRKIQFIVTIPVRSCWEALYIDQATLLSPIRISACQPRTEACPRAHGAPFEDPGDNNLGFRSTRSPARCKTTLRVCVSAAGRYMPPTTAPHVFDSWCSFAVDAVLFVFVELARGFAQDGLTCDAVINITILAVQWTGRYRPSCSFGTSVNSEMTTEGQEIGSSLCGGEIDGCGTVC